MNNHAWLNDPQIRNNAIITVTTHGEFILDDNTGQTSTFQVPNEMNIIYMNSVAPGVCNYVDSNTMKIYNDVITSILENINNALNLLTPNVTEDTLQLVKKEFFDLNKNLSIVDKKFRFDKYSRDKNITDPDITEYVNAFDRSHSVQFYKSGERINNKTFIRKDYELLTSTDMIDFRINMLSKYGNDDLMTEINQYNPSIMNQPQHESRITLEELLTYLSQLNIKNVLIFDFTCSSFVSNNSFINNPRNVRKLRLELQKEQSNYTIPNISNRLKVKVPTQSSSSSSSTAGGKRVTRKNRKTRKYRKTRKSRKTRK